MSKMMEKIIDKCHNNGLTTNEFQKHVMIGLLGSRIISKQEVCHFILRTTMVSSSHQFREISLNNTFDCMINLNLLPTVDVNSESNKTSEEREKD